MRSFSQRILAGVLLAGVLVTAGCAKNFIPNTDVEETDLNRKVIQYCEDYRRAVERRNIAYLLKNAHPSYYEDGATIDTSDDLDFAGLEKYLAAKFRFATAIRYEIHYRNVTQGRKDTIFVDFTYSASYKLPDGEVEVWHREVQDNQLVLVASGDTFKILAGM